MVESREVVVSSATKSPEMLMVFHGGGGAYCICICVCGGCCSFFLSFFHSTFCNSHSWWWAVFFVALPLHSTTTMTRTITTRKKSYFALFTIWLSLLLFLFCWCVYFISCFFLFSEKKEKEISMVVVIVLFLAPSLQNSRTCNGNSKRYFLCTIREMLCVFLLFVVHSYWEKSWWASWCKVYWASINPSLNQFPKSIFLFVCPSICVVSLRVSQIK